MKLYQGGDDVNTLIEELQQLDQTVPANLAAAAAAAAVAANQNLNQSRNSPRSNQQSQNYLSNYNLMQQQNLQMAQQHHNNMHGQNSHKQFPQHQNNYQQVQLNFILIQVLLTDFSSFIFNKIIK